MEKLPAIGEYVLRSKLGESSLSTVWEAEHRTTGQMVALKQIQVRKLTRHLKNCLECELSFLSSVNHPNIIRLLDVLEVKGCIVLVLEFCAGGNLASYIKHCGRVQECTAKRFMLQLGAGLKVLKSHNIIHRDLKPENILLSSCECDPVLKIADFGLSRWTCGALAQFFLNFSMAALLFMVGLVSSFYSISRPLHLLLFLDWFFHSCIPTLLICVQDYCQLIQIIVCPSKSFISTTSYKLGNGALPPKIKVNNTESYQYKDIF